MKIQYDPEADALYIQLREVFADHGVDIEEGVTIDLDKDRHIIGIEILDASERLGPAELATVSFERLLPDEPVAVSARRSATRTKARRRARSKTPR